MTNVLKGSFNSTDRDRPHWDANTTEIASYEYHRADGKYAYTKVRGENSDGEKVFTTRRKNVLSFDERFEPEDKRDWFSGQGDEPNVPYRLPELVEATSGPDALVLVVEGEKDCETARKLGFTATTNPNGALKWEDSYSQYLKDCNVAIVPDNDERGLQHAEKVAKSAFPVASSVKILTLPDLAEKGDLTDWVLSKGDAAADDLRQLIASASEYQEPQKGNNIANVDNVAQILESNPVWANVMAYDEFADQLMLLKPVPGTKAPKSRFRPRQWTDNDDISALRWFNRNGFPRVSKAIISDAIKDVAQRSMISPVADYLLPLEWDGIERLSRWLIDYGGAETDDDDLNFDVAKHEYVCEVGRRWMISAVARALDPGNKVDSCLILEGPQGVGKSTLLRVLADGSFLPSGRASWFSDSLQQFAGRDAQSALRGCWILELPELAAMRRSEVETIKAYLSKQEDRYRPAYGRYEVQMPRRCVFAGTTNRTDYLRDETGNRRFWPVTLTKVEFEQLGEDRDQLWAEAVRAFQAGELWHLSGNAERYQKSIANERTEEEPWAHVLKHLPDIKEVTTRDVLSLLGKALKDQSKNDAIRAGGMLQRAGWHKHGRITSGPNRGMGRYVNPNADAVAALTEEDISMIQNKLKEEDIM
ncbi:MAG: VapE domain-containing protein [Tateyamaria sp.]|uniref:VapE domain-containing protein n=1 Tax=Tateyamaria sp. TaxID=1929288 RepID=UPI0032941E04